MQQNPILLVDNNFSLQKMPGKGGWTYVLLPELQTLKNAHFGTKKVFGSIDDYELAHFSLMPFGNGMMFFPVKSEIRKAIGKQQGDTVRLKLYSDELPLPTIDDFYSCLLDEPKAYQKFEKMCEVDKNKLLNWIFALKSEKTIVERMATALNRLLD